MPFRLRLFGRSDLETWRGINGLGRSNHDHASGRRRQLSNQCKTQSRCTGLGRRETYEAADRITSACHPGRRRRWLMMSPRGGLVMCVRIFIDDCVVLDRRSTGVRKRHQRSMPEAHESEHDRKDDTAQCGSGSIRAHGSHVATARAVASPPGDKEPGSTPADSSGTIVLRPPCTKSAPQAMRERYAYFAAFRDFSGRSRGRIKLIFRWCHESSQRHVTLHDDNLMKEPKSARQSKAHINRCLRFLRTIASAGGTRHAKSLISVAVGETIDGRRTPMRLQRAQCRRQHRSAIRSE